MKEAKANVKYWQRVVKPEGSEKRPKMWIKKRYKARKKQIIPDAHVTK
jgi:hypothetical protein